VIERESTRLHALLAEALVRPPESRRRWIDETCGGNPGLRERLEALLRIVESESGGGSDPTPGRRSGRGLDDTGPDVRDHKAIKTLLAPGQQLGRYEILELLGSGGMGTVYRALDSSLRREVAIKALAYAFHGDSGSLRRFEREARVLAALSHPNIAAIYGFEHLEGSPYLVLERVEGETLAARLKAGPMPLADALAVASQIVDGLEEAHAKGVIHRDLKPSNVMLAPGLRAKLVDFGLAKTASTRDDQANLTESITEVGAVVGTARYMSPEQVRGEAVDARTDVWAFGCVLYEMLAGKAAFPGDAVPEVLAAVLRDDPDWDALPKEVPPSIQRLLRRCLRRDARERLQHIGDARLEIVDAHAEPPAASASRWSSARLWWGLAAISLVVLTALVASRIDFRPRSAAAPAAARLSLELPANVALTSDYPSPFAVSPSGSTVIVEATEGGTRRLYVRGLDDVTLRPLAGTEGARQPFFSADGKWIAFFADRKLATMPVGGGPILQLADVGGNPRGATWADGTIVIAASQTSGLARISDRGGSSVALTTLDRARGEYSHRWPDALPGGKWVLFTVGFEDASFDEARIEAVSLESGERRVILTNAGFARYLAAGRLLFARGGRLHVVAFDPARLTVSGVPDVLIDGIRYDPRNGGCHLAVSAAGIFVYGPGVPMPSEYYLSWIDRAGHLQRAVDTARPFRDPRIGPDGGRIATVVGTSRESDLWVVDGTATFSRLTFNLSPHRPIWTPNGSRITVGAESSGTWRLLSIASDGSGSAATLFEGPNRVYPDAWTPDGKSLVFQESRPHSGWDLRVLDVDASGKPAGTPRTLVATPFHEANAALSHDGRWVAYESDEVDAIVQIYVRSFPDGAHKIRVSTGGARLPVWGRGGHLYYRHTGEDRVHLVRTKIDRGVLAVESVEPVWAAEPSRLLITVAGARFDVNPADTKFMALEGAGPALAPPFSRPVVVLAPPGAPH
jgi:serine/threonine-protein kinase